MKKRFGFKRKRILLIVLCSIGFSSFLFSKEVSKDKNQLLFEAVASENLTEIKRLLDLGADPNSECPNGYYYVINIYDKCTLWDVVIRENLHRTLSLLLKGGLKEKYVGGALDSAAQFQRLEIAKILIQHGFKKDQGHALEFASTHCNLSMLRLLLKAGLDPNTSKDWVDMSGSSIVGSFRKDCVPAAVELIQAGADVNKDPKLMIWAARSGARDVYFVLKKTNVKFDVKTVLQEAKKGYENIEKMIKIWDGSLRRIARRRGHRFDPSYF
ncbi:ankyrin repeat domain-containing protein [Leptospira alexanderi]|uniref:ankyrin repeat domain-containing protein n=1 Tax=Leptospira alexanderi TaxID=100053 RepID=UPI001FD1B5F6|nr:ankyrin repeat domain-containing protein [Leptospira alexanderi]